MRVSKFCRDNKLEIEAVWNISISESNDPGSLLFDDVLLEDWLERWIKLLLDVLKKNWLTQSDCSLDDRQEFRVGKFDSLDVVVLLHALDPFVSLGLWINKERPSLSLRANDTIFDGELICRKALNIPLSDLDWVSKNALNGEIIGVWDLLGGGEFHPALEKTRSVASGERSNVGNVTGGKDNVTNKVNEILFKNLDSFGPSNRLIGKTHDQLLSSSKVNLNSFLVFLQFFELSLVGSIVRLEVVNVVSDLLESSLFLLKFCHSYREITFGLGERCLFWLDYLHDCGVVIQGLGPHTDGHTGL